MGRRHARVLGELTARFEVVGAYDVRGGGALTSEAEAIARAELVVVATPMGAHAGTASRALAAGRHVLVEKPVCATAAEASALLEARASSGRHLFVGHSERFNPVVRALARLLRGDGVVGIELRRVGATRADESGVLVSLGVHDFDLASYLVGAPITVTHAAGRVDPAGARGAGEDLAHVLFTSEKGSLGHLYVDRTAPDRRRAIVVLTASWVYEGDLLAHRLTRTSRATGVRTEVPLVAEEPLAAQALAIAEVLEGGVVREVATGADGARALALAEGAAAQVLVRRDARRAIP
jgi:predicted dehydrogenase